MEQILNWFLANGKIILDIIAYIIAASSLIVKLTPTPQDDTILAKIVDFLKKLSLYKEQ